MQARHAQAQARAHRPTASCRITRGTTTHKCVHCHTRVQEMYTWTRCTHDNHTRTHTQTQAQPRDTLARGCANVRGCTTAPRGGCVTIARGCTPTRGTPTRGTPTRGCTTTHNACTQDHAQQLICTRTCNCTRDCTWAHDCHTRMHNCTLMLDTSRGGIAHGRATTARRCTATHSRATRACGCTTARRRAHSAQLHVNAQARADAPSDMDV